MNVVNFEKLIDTMQNVALLDYEQLCNPIIDGLTRNSKYEKIIGYAFKLLDTALSSNKSKNYLFSVL